MHADEPGSPARVFRGRLPGHTQTHGRSGTYKREVAGSNPAAPAALLVSYRGRCSPAPRDGSLRHTAVIPSLGSHTLSSCLLR
jgi:hypothetical protein